MKKANRVSGALVLIAVFAIAFLAVFMAIFLTQSAYSMPSSYAMVVNGMEITVGPVPNSSAVSLNTAITVEAVASASLNDMQVAPEIPIARTYSESTGPLTYLNVFCPAVLLEPATSYTVSVTVMDTPVTWRFITTSDSFRPGVSFYLAKNVHWIALLTASLLTIIAGFALQRWQKQAIAAKPLSRKE